MISKKSLWLSTKIVFWVLLIGQTLYIYLDYASEENPFNRYCLRELVNSAIGIPYYQLQNVHLRNNAPELKPIPKEDWYNVKCTHTPVLPILQYVLPKEVYAKLPEATRDRLNCLAVRDGSAKYSSDPVTNELCGNYFNCLTFDLGVEDYVLEKPDILWNIIKVLERPCDFIDTLENVKKKPEVIEQLKNGEVDDRELWARVEGTKWRLGCNGRHKHWWLAEEKYTVLSIFNSKNRSYFSIVIKRKDI